MSEKSVLTCTTDERVVLVPVAEASRVALANLFQLYVHDFSSIVPLDVDDSGRFDVPIPETWWSADDHYAYLVREDDTLRGFVVVRRGSRVTDDPEPMDVAELFVVRSARGRGLGAKVVETVLDAFRGRWEVRVRDANAGALAFWTSIVETEGGEDATRTAHAAQGVPWTVFRFTAE